MLKNFTNNGSLWLTSSKTRTRMDFSNTEYYIGNNARVGLGIFMDRDQRSILLGFEILKSVFYRYWSQLL